MTTENVQLPQTLVEAPDGRVSSVPSLSEFQEFPKIARLSRECIISEKIDGTNAQILITENGEMHIGSRTRWLTPETGDNHGFMLWALTHKDELMTLGAGRHFGEWWGSGIQRGYGLAKGEKRLSLFNVARWCLHGATPERIAGYSQPMLARRQSPIYAPTAARPHQASRSRRASCAFTSRQTRASKRRWRRTRLRNLLSGITLKPEQRPGRASFL